jgi:hypothetical protein
MPLSQFELNLINTVLKKNFPAEKTVFTPQELLFILREFKDQDKYTNTAVQASPKYKVIKNFVNFLLYRSLSNFDSMLLCLSGGTEVLTKAGPRRIDSLPIGENELISYDFSIGKIVSSTGILWKTGKKKVFVLRTVDGREVKASPEHKFFVRETDGSIIRKHLVDIVVGDELVCQDVQFVRVESIREKSFPVETYDFHVPIYNNFFLKNKILVSNCEGIKGAGKSSFAVMLAMMWCKMLDIKFDTTKHIAYTNAQVMHALDTLPPFSPLVCDESVNFCLLGSTLVRTPTGTKRMDELGTHTVMSFNRSRNTIVPARAQFFSSGRKEVFAVTLDDGSTINTTEDHRFLVTRNNKDLWTNIRQLKEGDEVKRVGRMSRLSFPSLELAQTCRGGGSVVGLKVQSITSIGIHDVYDASVPRYHNFILDNGVIAHNCLSEEWASVENRELRKKLAQIRTKHFLFILCFPMKINKVQKTYLESFVNYWISIFYRGTGAIFIRDMNPAFDAWRIKDFADIGSYNEFTPREVIMKKLEKHPNFWKMLSIPPLPAKVYEKYLKVREKNVYNTDTALSTVTRETVMNALLVQVLRDIMMKDGSVTLNRLSIHLRNEYDLDVKRSELDAAIKDAEALVKKGIELGIMTRLSELEHKTAVRQFLKTEIVKTQPTTPPVTEG